MLKLQYFQLKLVFLMNEFQLGVRLVRDILKKNLCVTIDDCGCMERCRLGESCVEMAELLSHVSYAPRLNNLACSNYVNVITVGHDT